MATVIENVIEIARTPEDVFDYLSDLGNEVRWNPDCLSMEQLTDGPVGVGTRFRAKWKQGPVIFPEVTAYERPRTWTYDERRFHRLHPQDHARADLERRDEADVARDMERERPRQALLPRLHPDDAESRGPGGGQCPTSARSTRGPDRGLTVKPAAVMSMVTVAARCPARAAKNSRSRTRR